MKAILNWTMFVAVTILYWFVLAHLPGNVEALKLVATVADVILIIKVFADDDVVGGLWATCLAALVVATVYYFTVLIGKSVDAHFSWAVDGVFAAIWLIWVDLHIRGYLTYETMMPKKRPGFCVRIDDLGHLGECRHAVTVGVVSLGMYMLTLELLRFLVLALFVVAGGLLVRSLVAINLDAKKRV